MTDPRSFNFKLQSRILELGYKNYKVAYACGIHESDFSRILNGRRDLTPKQEQELCEFLDASPRELGL